MNSAIQFAVDRVTANVERTVSFDSKTNTIRMVNEPDLSADSGAFFVKVLRGVALGLATAAAEVATIIRLRRSLHPTRHAFTELLAL